MENKFKMVSTNYRKFITVLLIANACKLNSLFGKFLQQDIVTVMHNKYNLPAHITVGLLEELAYKGLVYEEEYADGVYHFNEPLADCSIATILEKLDHCGDNSHAMQMTSDAHMIGKEADLWQYINEGKCDDSSVLDLPLSHFPE